METKWFVILFIFVAALSTAEDVADKYFEQCSKHAASGGNR